MVNKTELNYFDVWKDICFYEVYMDKISYENYLIYLSNKYCIDLEILILKMKEVKNEAQKRIQEYHEKQKDYQPLLKTECEEEKIKSIIEYNRKCEELKEDISGECSLTINKIKKLGFLKTIK